MLWMQEGNFQVRCLSLLVSSCQNKYLELPDLLFYSTIVISEVIEVPRRQSQLVLGGLDMVIQVTLYSAENEDARAL